MHVSSQWWNRCRYIRPLLFRLCLGCWVPDKEEHRAAERARFWSWGCLSADGGRQGTNNCQDGWMFKLPPEDSGLPPQAQWFRSFHSSDRTQGGCIKWCVVIRVKKERYFLKLHSGTKILSCRIWIYNVVFAQPGGFSSMFSNKQINYANMCFSHRLDFDSWPF